jgi:hypothetical protein
MLTLQEEYFAMLNDASRCFRTLAVTESPSDIETDVDSMFSSVDSVSTASSVLSNQSTRSASRYRHRYGRGGRVYVDRTLTADEKDESEKNQLKIMLQNPELEERSRFEPRASEEQKLVAVNEFSIAYILYRVSNNRQISYRARLLPPQPPRNIGAPIRVGPGNMSSPPLSRPQLSPSASRQSLPFPTPK